MKAMKKLSPQCRMEIFNDKKAVQGFTAVSQYTSTRDGQSPAQKLFGHPMQDTIPAHPWLLLLFISEWQHSAEEVRTKNRYTEEC